MHGQGGATAGEVLEPVSRASWQAALEPLLASNSVLLSDGGRTYPVVRGGQKSGTSR